MTLLPRQAACCLLSGGLALIPVKNGNGLSNPAVRRQRQKRHGAEKNSWLMSESAERHASLDSTASGLFGARQGLFNRLP
jgi:hypothetical protein